MVVDRLSVACLHVDRVFEDSLAVPAGVDRWLRSIELKARDLRRALHEVPGDEVVPSRFVEIRQRLDQLLDDEHASTLHRLLRRPLSQMRPGSVAYRTFTEHTNRLFADAQKALQTQEAVEALRRERERVRQEHSGRMPLFTLQMVSAAHVNDDVLTNVRRPSDVRLMNRRLTRAESELSRLARQLPYAGAEEQDLVLDGLGRTTAVELWASLQLRLHERSYNLHSFRPTERLRDLQASQINALGRKREVEGVGGPAPSVNQTVAENMANQTLNVENRPVDPWEDCSLWPSLVAAAERGRFESARGTAWQPRMMVDDGRAVTGESGDNILYVVPFSSEFAFISPDIPSPVQVWSRGIREGSEVECRVFGRPNSPIPLESAKGDIDPLFDGVLERAAGWYRTKKRSHLEILCAYRNGWFARVRARGAVRLLGTPAWEQGDDTATAVRVFLSGQDSSQDPIRVGPTNSAPMKFLGVTTRNVVVPHLACRRGWLRTSEASSEQSDDPLEREHKLFRALRRIQPRIAPVSLGLGDCIGVTTSGRLYVPPLAYTLAESPLIKDWISTDPVPFLGAVANLFLNVREAGYALSVYDLRMFAFGLQPAEQGTFRPLAVLIAAPGAVRLGQMFPRMTIGQSAPTYPHLGFRGFAPAVAQSKTALPEADAVGLALMLLDMMAPRPVSSETVLTQWKALPAHVEMYADQFRDSELALQIAAGMSQADHDTTLLRIVEKLAGASLGTDVPGSTG